jgi:hypothetical protein
LKGGIFDDSNEVTLLPCSASHRSIVVSKSLAMIERRVVLFAHLHVNKDAAPEMYRLPIQVGGAIVLA